MSALLTDNIIEIPGAANEQKQTSSCDRLLDLKIILEIIAASTHVKEIHKV